MSCNKHLDGKATAFEIITATSISLAVSVWMIQVGASKLNDEKLLLGVEARTRSFNGFENEFQKIS